MVFGIEIDRNIFVARVSADKLQKTKDALTLHESQSLTILRTST